MAAKVVGLGAGGHAKALIEILTTHGAYDLVALTDPRVELHGTDVLGIPVIGTDDRIPELIEQGVNRFFIGVGATGDNAVRRALYRRAIEFGLTPLRLLHPTAVVSGFAELGKGCTVLTGAVVNAGAVLEKNVLINSGAIVEHDCIIEDHAHIATGAVLLGGVRVGKSAHVGAGATVKQLASIGTGAVVGAGAVVLRDVPANTVVAGVPAAAIHSKLVPGGDPES